MRINMLYMYVSNNEKPHTHTQNIWGDAILKWYVHKSISRWTYSTTIVNASLLPTKPLGEVLEIQSTFQ